jgi:hypothetical protein
MGRSSEAVVAAALCEEGRDTMYLRPLQILQSLSQLVDFTKSTVRSVENGKV